MWTRYQLRLQFTTRLCGSTPADPEIIEAWLKARRPAVRPPGARSIEEIQEEVFNSLAEPEEDAPPNILVFQRVDGACVMRAETVRAHIKDCARQLSAQYIGSTKGERTFATRVLNGVYHDPAVYWLPILRPDGSPVLKHDGEQDRAIHVRGPRGELLNALKRYEWIQPARIDVQLLVLTARGERRQRGADGKMESVALPTISQPDLEKIFQYGAVHGYGGERGAGEGRYLFTLEQMGED